MCLREITKNINPPDPAERVAWKIMYKPDRTGTTLCFPYMNHIANRGVWLKAKHRDSAIAKTLRVEGGDASPYPVGFHCLPTRAIARKYKYYDRSMIIIKVKVRNVHTLGTQKFLPILVASEILFPVESR